MTAGLSRRRYRSPHADQRKQCTIDVVRGNYRINRLRDKCKEDRHNFSRWHRSNKRERREYNVDWPLYFQTLFIT